VCKLVRSVGGTTAVVKKFFTPIGPTLTITKLIPYWVWQYSDAEWKLFIGFGDST